MTAVSQNRTRGSLWAVGLLAATFSLVRLLTYDGTHPSNQAASAAPGLATARPSPVTGLTAATQTDVVSPDASWSRLSSAQQQALAPLKPVWPKLEESARRRWLTIASGFSSKTRAAQERMHARMAQWNRLSPSQRAEARLRYLQTASLTPKWKRERWELYKNMTPEPARQVHATRLVEAVPPVSVRGRPGATTIPMPLSAGRMQVSRDFSATR
jgi:hypothetical protein